MSDPLSLVRQATMSGNAVKYIDHHYIFGNSKYHESIKTCFKRTLKGTEDFFYSLRDVIFFLENADTGVGEYRRMCVEMRTTAVVEHDKKTLKEYLTGVIDTCPQLDLNALSAAAALPHSTTQISNSEHDMNLNTPLISMKEMEEHKQRHAALIDQSIHRPSTVSVPQSGSLAIGGLSVEKLEELRLLRRSQKRKVVHMEGNIGDIIDAGFIKADRQLLAELRSDELPSHTRSSVLSKPGAV